MSQEKQNPENQINIELTEEVAEGHFVNLAMIAHSSSEFVIDFVRMMPGTPKAKVKSRIVITPEHAKRLYKALGENLARFEGRFGPIKETQEPAGFPMNFGGSVGEA